MTSKASLALRVPSPPQVAVLSRVLEDERPDLLLLRLRVPTIGTVLRGLFSAWDVDLSFAGYANADGRQFERKPRWRSEVALRLPAIIGVLRDLGAGVPLLRQPLLALLHLDGRARAAAPDGGHGCVAR